MIVDQFLTNWFVKSLLPPISRDVTMGGVTKEEEVISRAQYLNLVYSQSGVLYDIIKYAPHTSLYPSLPTSSGHVDGVIGKLETQSKTQMNKSSQKNSKNKTVNQAQPSSPSTTSYVNVVQSSKSDKKQCNESKQKEKSQKDFSKI